MVTSIQPGSAIKRFMYTLQMKPNCAIGFAEPTQTMIWIPGFDLSFEFI